MSIMWTKDTIAEEVRQIVAKSLMLKPGMVTQKSRLFLDLEAESIDILDIRFAVESKFGFKFQNDEIRELLQAIATDQNVTEKDIPELFTVSRLVDFVVYKVAPRS